jgi:heme/copper-type cytochrome/quinol oxidase subunit 2
MFYIFLSLFVLIHIFYYFFLIAILLQIINLFNYKESKENGKMKLLHRRGSYVLVILISLIIIYVLLGGNIYELDLIFLRHII